MLLKKDALLPCLLIFGLVYIPFWAQHSFSISIFCASCLGFSIIVSRVNYSVPMWIKMCLLVFAVALLLFSYGHLRGLEPALSFLALLTSIKLLEMKTKRDFFVFIMIVELLFIGHLLIEESLVLILYIYLVSLIIFLFMATFQGGDGPFRLNKGRTRPLIGTFLLSLPVAGMLFLIFPRLPVGNLFFFNFRNLGTSGFSDSLNPGEISKLVRDDTPVFRASFVSGDIPSYEQLYWRGMVLDHTEGFKWKQSKVGPHDLHRYGQEVVRSYAVSFSEFLDTTIFTLSGTNKIHAKSVMKVFNAPGSTFKLLQYSNQKARFVAYQSPVTPRPIPGNLRQNYLKVPKSTSTRLRDFALGLKGIHGDDPKALAQKLMSHFSENPYYYTLTPGEYSSEKPIDEFFFERRKGFCEHYAAVTALILRLADIPSRVVVGFQGGQFNPYGKYFIIRNMDAHAWVEAWFDDVGWKRFDPTYQIAPTRIEHGADAFFSVMGNSSRINLSDFLKLRESSILRKIILLSDMAYYSLSQSFLAYDHDAQKDLFFKLGITKGRVYKLSLITALFVFVVFCLIWWWIRNKNSGRNVLEQTYALFCHKLAIKGIKRSHNQGPIDFLAAIGPQVVNYPEVERIISVYIDLKYRGVDSDKKLREFRRAVKSFDASTQNV